MKRILTAITCLGFLAMLAATSKRPDPPRTTTTPPGPQVPIPATTNWQVRESTDLGVVFQMPPGATDVTSSSQATRPVLAIRMTPTITIVFDRVMGEQTDIARERELYRTKVPGFGGFLHDAADSLVADLQDRGSRFCQVTACSAGDAGLRVCTRAGALDAILTIDECVQVVAIARSMRLK